MNINTFVNDTGGSSGGQDMMGKFTQSFGFIVAFIFTVIIISMVFGDKPTMTFLWLVLLSMCILNSGKLIALMGRFSTV